MLSVYLTEGYIDNSNLIYNVLHEQQISRKSRNRATVAKVACFLKLSIYGLSVYLVKQLDSRLPNC